MKFIVIVFDGLRTDMITEGMMPNLFRLSSKGVVFENHRSVFPSDTFVNTASMVTGTFPSKHGIVAGHFLDPNVDQRESFAGNSVPSIEKAQRVYSGRLFDALSLGEILGKADRRMAIIGTTSSGSVRLIHHQVRDYNHLCLSCHTPETSFPRGEVNTIIRHFSRLPEKAEPDFKGTTYATDIFLGYFASGCLPDLTILWYGEPDLTYHGFGIGSPESLQALRHTDAEFGRIFDWFFSNGLTADLQLIVASDHGQITQNRKVSVAEFLHLCGFTIGAHLENDSDAALISGYSGNLLIRERSPDLISAIAEALMDFEGMGHLFTRGRHGIEGIVPGTFSMDLVMTEHRRSPDIAFVLAADDKKNDFGYPGTCYFDDTGSIGCGTHGGLHPMELNSVLMAMGSIFKENTRLKTHSGIVDILPTILHNLNLPIPDKISGRVLYEALHKGNDSVPAIEPEVFTIGHGSFYQSIKRMRVGQSIYLESGY